jgi:hypothetical protein
VQRFFTIAAASGSSSADGAVHQQQSAGGWVQSFSQQPKSGNIL